MTLADFVNRFDPKRNGDGYIMRCRAHEDDKASLTVNEGRDGRILLKCQAGCATDRVVAALGLQMRDLFSNSNGKQKRRIVATYIYRDVQGQPCYRKLRTEPKGFYFQRPDGNGGWTKGIQGVERLPYRVNELQRRTHIFINEGEKDADRLWSLGLPATTNDAGASKDGQQPKWTDALTQQLKAAGVTHAYLLPHNDDAGHAHMLAVAASLHAAGIEVRIVELPGLAVSGDVSDYLDAGHQDLLDRCDAAPIYTPPPAEPAPDPLPPSEPRTLAQVEAVFTKWIRDTDPIPTRVVLAAYVANRHLKGDPVWVMLVGGSGVGKTERLSPLSGMPDVVLESSITGPAALLSGTGKRDRAKSATGGLLRKFPGGNGVLLLKDFTSIIDMHRDARAEVLAAFREIYDGRWDRSVGVDGGTTLTWIGRLGLIAGCTSVIDSAHSVVSVMGTRFLYVRLSGDQRIAESAFDHVGGEHPMRKELRDAARGLLDHLPGQPYDKADVRGRTIALASYVARARSPVDRDQRNEIRLVLDPEAPTRIVKMLAQLWRAAGLLGLGKPDAWAMVRRVGMDSIPKLRLAILNCLASISATATTTTIAESVGHPTQTTRRALEDLTAHGAINRYPGGDGKADHWELTGQMRTWLNELNKVVTVPVSSEPADSEDETEGTVPVSSEGVGTPTDDPSDVATDIDLLKNPISPLDDETGTVRATDESELQR